MDHWLGEPVARLDTHLGYAQLVEAYLRAFASVTERDLVWFGATRGVLGWKQRDFYLDPDFYPAIFDWSGNCGTTAWWNGQIVGAYVQDDAGRVELIVAQDPGRAGRAGAQSGSEAPGGLA